MFVSCFKKMENREHLYTQKLFPTINNDDLLEFRIPPNQKGQLELSNVLLHFVINLPSPTDKSVKVLPQNFLGPKQFSSVEVRLNGEAVTRRSCANEYFLSSYFNYLINYSIDYQNSAMRSVGIYDYAQEKTSTVSGWPAPTFNVFSNNRATLGAAQTKFEVIMPIDSTIFYTNDLLPSNTALDLSFERLKASSSSLLAKSTTIEDFVLELNDCYLMLPFKRDENMFQLERNAIQKPLKIKFDDFVIKRFNVPRGTDSVMMSDIISGQLPYRIFWGLQDMASYGGSFENSSTRFNRNNVQKVNLYIDGKECDDFPLTLSQDMVGLPFIKFLQSTNQLQNGYMSRTLSLLEYRDSNCIFSSSLDPDTSGSLSFEFGFDSVINRDLVLIVCCLYDRTMKIDQRRNFQVT